MIFIVLLMGAYLISPIVFIPLYIIEYNKGKKLLKDNYNLHYRNAALYDENMRLSGEKNPAKEEPSQTQQSMTNNSNPNPQYIPSTYNPNPQYIPPTYNPNPQYIPPTYNPNPQCMPSTYNQNPQCIPPQYNPNTQYINPPYNPNQFAQTTGQTNYSTYRNNNYVNTSYPQYAPVNTSENENPVNTASILMTVGVVLVILSGLIFATTSWEYLPTFLRIVVVASFSVIFLASSAFAEKKLKIHKTALAFYSLGSAFIPVSVIAIGFFKLFGHWFSLYGDGKFLLMFTGFAALFVAMLVGIAWYSHKAFAIVAWSSLSAMIVCMVKNFYLPEDIFSLVMAAYCSLPILLGRRITALNVSEKVGLFTGYGEIFAMINTAIISIFCIMSSGMGIASGVSTIIFGCLYLTGIFHKKFRAIGGGSAFIVFAFVGVTRVISPDSFGNFTAIVTAASAVFVVIGMMKLFEGTMGKVLRIGAVIFAVSSMVMSLAVFAVREWTLYLVIAFTIMLINLIWLSFREKNRLLYFLVLGMFTFYISGVASFLHCSGMTTAIAVSTALAVVFAVQCIWKSNFFRYMESDIYILIVTLSSAMYISATSSDNDLACIYGYLIFCGIIFALSMVGKHELFRTFMKYMLPVFRLTLLIAPYRYFVRNGYVDLNVILFIAYILIITLPCAVLFIIYKNTDSHWFKSLGIYSFLGAILLPLFFLNSVFVSVIPAATAILSIIIFAVLYTEKKRIDFAFYMGASLISWTLLIAVFSMTENIDAAIIYASSVSFMVAILGILLKSKKENPVYYSSTRFAVVALLIFSFIFGGYAVLNQEIYWIISYFLGVGVLLLLTSKTKYNILLFIVLILFYPVINSAVSDTDHRAVSTGIVVIILIITSIIGRILNKEIYNDENSIVTMDHFALLNIWGILFVADKANSPVLFWVLLALYLINYYKRISKDPILNATIVTAASFCGCIVVWIQDFITIPQIVREEYNVLPILVLCFFLNRIWKNSAKSIEWVRFSIALFSILYLSGCAIFSGLSTDAVLLSLCVLVMIIASFIYKRKKWFILGDVTLVALVFYLTFQLWSSAVWWLYLLIAGGILITIASLNELKKQKGSSEKSIFNGWEW